MGIKDRIKRLEEKLGVNDEYEEYLEEYEKLENPTKEQEDRMFLLTVEKFGLEYLIRKSYELEEPRDEHGKTGGDNVSG